MKTYPYPAGKSAVKWVFTDWLNDHISDEGLMILDVQPNVHDYIMGHLPGAIYLNEGHLRSAHNGLPAVLVPPEILWPIFRQVGLQPNRPVVIYSVSGLCSKCTAGLEKWKEEGSFTEWSSHAENPTINGENPR